MRFAGYAAVFDRADRAGDVIRAGAFGGCRRGAAAVAASRPAVGRIETLAEDARGLRIAGVIDDSDVAALVARRAIDGLSVGYRPQVVRQGAQRELLRVALAEVSLVAVPMQPLARIERVG
ncbi:MAG: HK97 family phage prohead protease [Sphingomonas taxi]